MATAVTPKAEEKKTHAAPCEVPSERASLEEELGARAGVPIYLRRQVDAATPPPSAPPPSAPPPSAPPADSAPRLNDPRAPLPASARDSMDAKAAESAHALGARAYTVGRDIAFGAGQFSPGTTEGERLVAHELTHAVQQGRAEVGTPLVLRAAEHGHGAQSAPQEGAADGAVVRSALARRGNGDCLPEFMRREMEDRLGVDLQGARIHTDAGADAAARAVGARAFTVGDDIFFRAGAFSAGADGRALLAHELAHVAQARLGLVAAAPSSDIQVAHPDHPLERAAAAAGEEASQQGRASSGTGAARLAPARTAPATGGATIWRDPDQALLEPDQYVGMYWPKITADLGEAMKQAEVPTGSEYARWTTGSSQPFLGAVMEPMLQAGPNLWSTLVSTMGYWRARTAIVSGADGLSIHQYHGAGVVPPVYKSGVAQELRIAFSQEITASLERVMPRYAAARNQAALREEAVTKTSSVGPQPEPGIVKASHPLDRSVIDALMSGTVVIDYQHYREAHPAEQGEVELQKTLRPVSFIFQIAYGMWHWIRVTSPQDATPEEVAKELYGDEALAYLITPAAPLFGFELGFSREVSGPRIELRPVHMAKWRALAADPSTPTSAYLDVSDTGVMQVKHWDPAHKQGLTQGGVSGYSPLAELRASNKFEEAALAQARTIRPSGAKKDDVVQRLALALSMLDGIIADAATFRLTRGLTPVRAALAARAAMVRDSSDPAVAGRWDAHSTGQLSILTGAWSGLRMAVEQKRAMTPPKDPHGVELPPYVQQPIVALAIAYVDAAAYSDLYQVGKAKLAAADEKSKTFAVEMMEGILASLRPVIESAKTDKSKAKAQFGTSNEAQYEVSDMEARERQIRAQLVAVREAIRLDPSRAPELLAKVQESITQLQTEVTLVANMDSIDAMWRQLFDNISKLGVVTGKNERYDQAMDALHKWKAAWYEVFLAYKYGNKKWAKGRLEQLQTDKGWINLFNTIGTIIEDEETFEMWVSIGIMIGIAIVTAGVGAYVSAAAGAAWGTAGWGAVATFGATTTAEALTFTTLSTALLNRDPSLKGFIFELGKNLLMFGVFRGVGAGYKAVVGAEFAATTAGKAGEIMTMYIGGTAAALAEARIAKGRALTDGEAYDVMLQSAVVLAGTIIGQRVAKPFLEGMHVRGTQLGERIATINQTRVEIRAGAASLKKTDFAAARELTAKDRTLVEQENAVLKDIQEATSDPDPVKAQEKAKSLGLTKEDVAEVASLRTESDAVLADRKQAAVMMELEPVGPRDFLCEHGKLGEVMQHHTELGNTVAKAPPDPITKAPTAEITLKAEPKADPAKGQPEPSGQTPPEGARAFRVTEKLPGTGEGVVGRPAEPMAAIPGAEPTGVAPGALKPAAGPAVPETSAGAEGAAKYESLMKTSRRYKAGKGYSREDFIARYEKGWRFEDGHWLTSEGTRGKPPEKFANDVSTDQVYDRLAGDASDSSFKSYADKLKSEGIATESQIRSAIDAAKPQGRSIDAVRHQLKVQFREPLLQKMTSPDPVAMEQRYPDLPWVRDPEGALLQAKHREMVRITEGLNPSDMGNLAEIWYNRTYRPTEAQHVRITQEQLAAQGMTQGKDRVFDLVGTDTIREQYTGSGKFDARKMDQLGAHQDMLGRQGGFDVTVNGQPVRVTKGVVVLTNPRGVKANAGTMYDILTRNPSMRCEIFNAKGEMKVIDQSNSVELLEPALSTWLAIP